MAIVINIEKIWHSKAIDQLTALFIHEFLLFVLNWIFNISKWNVLHLLSFSPSLFPKQYLAFSNSEKAVWMMKWKKIAAIFSYLLYFCLFMQFSFLSFFFSSFRFKILFCFRLATSFDGKAYIDKFK